MPNKKGRKLLTDHRKNLRKIWDWFNLNQGGIQALLTIFLVIFNGISLYSLFQTRESLTLTNQDIMARNRPYLEIAGVHLFIIMIRSEEY